MGAGRAITRHRARNLDDETLGPATLECISLHAERLREEAPAAYKADLREIRRWLGHSAVCRNFTIMKTKTNLKAGGISRGHGIIEDAP